MIGSLNSIQATAEKLSIPQLQQAMRDGTLPPYVGIPLLQKKVQMQKQMQMASQSQQPRKPSIAEQVNQEATADEMMRQRARMMQAEMGQTGGISDFLPKGEESYAKGGPIAFAEKGYVDPEFVGEWNPPSEAEFYAMEQQRKLREKNRSMFDAMQANNATQYRYLPSPEGKTWDQFNEALGASNYEALPYHIPSREMAAAEDNYMSLGKSNLQAVNANAITGRLLAAESQFGFSKPNEYGLFPDIERLRKLPLAKGNDPDYVEPEFDPYARLKKAGSNIAEGLTKTLGYLYDTPTGPSRIVYGGGDYNRVQSKPAPELRAQQITLPVSTQTQPAITPTAPTTAPAQAMQNRIAARKAMPVAGSVVPVVQTPYAQAMPAAPSPIDYSKFKYSADETDPAKLIAQREAFYGEDKTGQTLKDYLAQQGEKVSKEEERAPWMALMQAGLATMAGTSPFAMANIGAGGIQGLNAYTKAQDKLDSAREKMFDLQSKYDMAKRAEHVSAVTSGLQSADTKALKNKTLDLQEAQDKQKALVDEREFKLKQQELAARERMNQENNAVRREVYSGGIGGLKPYQADQLRKSAVTAVDKLLKDVTSAEYKEFSALKTKAEKDQYKQNLTDSYFARYTGAVPSAPATAQAPYDLNWAQ